MGAQRFCRRALRAVGAAAVSLTVVILPAVGAASADPGYGPKLGSSGGQPPATTLPVPVTSPTAVQTSSQTGVLAFTGAEIAAMTAGGAAAIGAGGFLVLATRRRRHAGGLAA